MFGQLIRFIRLSKCLKQSELANKLGISNCTLAHYESGYRSINIETFKYILDECNYDMLFLDKDSNKILRLDDIGRIDYDIRVTDKGKKKNKTAVK